MKNLIFGILLLTINFVSAQNSQNSFEEGNKEYQSEAYEKAIGAYEQVLQTGMESSELYFNLANAYYKTNKMADAIYYYEKALQLNPANEDARLNLAYANRSIIDSIKEVPKSVFQKFNENVLSILSYNNWSKVVVALSLFGGLFWMIFFFSTQPTAKKLYFTISIFLTFICVISLAITIQQYQNAKNTVYAIVFSEEVSVVNEPIENASEVFVLHSGTKLKVLGEQGKWQKIKISDGQIGWIAKKVIKKL